MNIAIRAAASPKELAETRALFEEYAESLRYGLCFQSFAEEVAALPGDYAPPKGGIWLATGDDGAAGCIALRPLSEQHAEMKRLYVRPNSRGAGAGKALVKTAIEEATRIGYKKVRLDTLPRDMASAVKLYRAFGFAEIQPYMKNPIDGALCMELTLP